MVPASGRLMIPNESLLMLLPGFLSIDEKSITEIKQTRKAQGRVVYEWRARGKRTNYMILVSRPYWLSFYAKDAKRIAWVAIAAYESSCR